MWEPAKSYEPEGTVSMEVPVYRRWWQLWLPRVVGSEVATFEVVSVGRSDPTAPGVSEGIWGPIGA